MNRTYRLALHAGNLTYLAVLGGWHGLFTGSLPGVRFSEWAASAAELARLYGGHDTHTIDVKTTVSRRVFTDQRGHRGLSTALSSLNQG